MWIVQWLIDRFSKLVSILDVLFAPLIHIINNVFTIIANSVFSGEQRTQIFAIGRDSILDNVLRQFTNFLHNIGLTDTQIKVGSEQQQRVIKDILLDQKADKVDFDAKAALIQKEGQLKAIIDSKAATQALITAQGDNANKSLIDQLGDLFNTFKGNFDGWFSLVGDLLTRFANDPLGFIAAILFEIVTEILIYQLAVGIARPGLDIGAPPTFGNGGANNGGNASATPDKSLWVLAPVFELRLAGLPYLFPQHPALDLDVPKGTPVYAAHSGKVIELVTEQAPLGTTITIQGGKHWTKYQTILVPLVAKGAAVTTATIIGNGSADNEGHKPHLHFELRINGVYFDPVLSMNPR